MLITEKKNKNIFDIVIYGSIAKGKETPNDIDIVVVFLSGSLRQRMDRLQEIKQKARKFDKLDMKQILLHELFSAAFMARTGILEEGISVFQNRKFSETLGFRSYTLFSYSLKGLSHSEKVRFNYLLAGRTVKGIINQLKGERIVNGAVKIPVENTLVFEDILKRYRISYNIKSILEEI
ncbi:MAG: nucleotidyltransferase domain-containing protein [archaeon]